MEASSSSSKTYSWRVMESCPVAKPCAGVKLIDVEDAAAPSTSKDADARASSSNIASNAASSNIFNMVDVTRLKRSTLDENDATGGDEGLLGLDVFNQEDLERGIMEQVDTALEEEERKRRRKRAERELKSVRSEISEVEKDLEKTEKGMAKLEKMEKEGSMLFGEVQKDWDTLGKHKEVKRNQLKTLKAKRKRLEKVLSGKEGEADEEGAILGDVFGDKKRKETERERKIRLGEITPFGTAGKDVMSKTSTAGIGSKSSGGVDGTPVGSDFEEEGKDDAEGKIRKRKSTKTKSRRETKTDADAAESSQAPNLFDSQDRRRYKNTDIESTYDFSRLRHSRATGFAKLGHNFDGDGQPDAGDDGNDNEAGDDEWRPFSGGEKDGLFDAEDASSSDDGDEGSGEEEDIDEIGDEDGEPKAKRARKGEGVAKKKKTSTKSGKRKLVKGSIGSRPVYQADDSEGWKDSDEEEEDDDDEVSPKKIKRLAKVHDDGDYKTYKKRVEKYKETRVKSKQKDVEFEGEGGGGNLKVPGETWAKLYPYQRTGVRWLWELHQQVRTKCFG